MNYLTGAEALFRVATTAAHGGDEDDGYTISDEDFRAVCDVAKWLLAGAVHDGRFEYRTVYRLPTVDIRVLKRLAVGQALEESGGNAAAACRAMGISTSTLWQMRASGRLAARPLATEGSDSGSDALQHR